MADNQLSRINDINDILSTNAYSTIDTTDPQNAIKVVTALTGAESLSQSGVSEFTLTDLVFKPNMLVDNETGETTEIEDVYLFADDGHIYYSRSRGIYNSVKMIVAFVSQPLNLRVRVVSRQTGRGMYKQLVPVQ